jgi:2-desacetyl-2-hydroxyethyl bacteriochlorophyllide A dehydrogenase
MKVAIYKRPNEMAVTGIAKPQPAAGEVLLKVHVCGICGSDLHAVQYGLGLKPDCVMGHEFCGEVQEIGPGVSGYQLGDRVAALPFVTCGTCDRCKRGMEIHCHNLKGLGLGQLPGGYAEFVACDAKSLFKLPDKVGSRDGALVEPLAVGLHAVKRSNLGPDSTAIVMGAGPIGLAVLTWAKGKGATVVVSELANGRSELACKLGADVVINPIEQNPADQVRELTGRSPELIFECIGVKGTLGSAIDLIGPRGTIVVVGLCMEPDQIMPLKCVMKETTINFSLGYDRADFDDTIAALASGRIRPQPMVTDIIGVEEVPAMFQALRKPGSRAKVLVEFPH